MASFSSTVSVQLDSTVVTPPEEITERNAHKLRRRFERRKRFELHEQIQRGELVAMFINAGKSVPKALELEQLFREGYGYRITSTKSKRLHKLRLYQADPRCCYCRASVDPDSMTLDHATPKAARGADSRWNLRLCCVKCNQQKQDMTEAEFRRGKLYYNSPREKVAAWIGEIIFTLLTGRVR